MPRHLLLFLLAVTACAAARAQVPVFVSIAAARPPLRPSAGVVAEHPMVPNIRGLAHSFSYRNGGPSPLAVALPDGSCNVMTVTRHSYGAGFDFNGDPLPGAAGADLTFSLHAAAPNRWLSLHVFRGNIIGGVTGTFARVGQHWSFSQPDTGPVLRDIDSTQTQPEPIFDFALANTGAIFRQGFEAGAYLLCGTQVEFD